MQTKLDKFGRVLIPKKIRDRQGLRPGSRLQIDEAPDHIILRAAGEGGRLVREDGVLVWSGNGPTEPHDIVKFIEDMRNERIRRTWGLETE